MGMANRPKRSQAPLVLVVFVHTDSCALSPWTLLYRHESCWRRQVDAAVEEPGSSTNGPPRRTPRQASTVLLHAEALMQPNRASRGSQQPSSNPVRASNNNDNNVHTFQGLTQPPPQHKPLRTVERTWVVYDTQGQHDPKLVRKHAATASANARKQTLERKRAARKAVTTTRGQAPDDRQLLPRNQRRPVPKKKEAVSELLTYITGKPQPIGEVDNGDGVSRLVHLLDMVQGAWEQYSDGLREATLAQKAIRTLLWDSYANSKVLFQAALFISGTHSNSCGLPPTVTVHMGPALLMLRGASLEAVQAEIYASGNDSSTPIAIALLAGWERRFGDHASYEVHMRAWRRMALPGSALQESHVSTLTDVTLEVFRQKLDESSLEYPEELSVSQTRSAPVQMASSFLPPGFNVLSTARPEARSLLVILAKCWSIPTEDPASVAARRSLGLQIVAWCTTHTLSCETIDSVEAQYHPHELMALYHARAALISINGLLLQETMHAHNVASTFDFQAAMDVHAMSCQHLQTETLIGTKYEGVAFSSRYLLCSISRDPDRDAFMRRMLHSLRLESWPQVRALLDQYTGFQPVVHEKCYAYYRLLTADPIRAIIEEVTN